MNIRDKLEIQIDGGLGNQLFKFYAGLYFSQKLDTQPIFNVSRLRQIAKLHPGENIQTLGLLDGYTVKSNSPLYRWDAIIRIQGAHQKYLSSLKLNLLGQFSAQAHEEIGYIEFPESTKPGKLANGYYQSWRYFEDLETKPIISYKSLTRPSQWLEDQLNLMAQVDPLVIHVRRGDYQLRKNWQIGCLSPKYFHSIDEKVLESNEIWIFTDTPETVKREFASLGIKAHVMQPPIESDPVESMILMSNASRIVISNSTFSWWAAKFAPPETVVYAPTKWFEHRSDPTDLIPPSWKRVKSDWMTQESFLQN
jgi:hypothetical protein